MHFWTAVAFILERLPKRFGIKARRTSITIKTLNGKVTNKSSVIIGMKVASSRDSSEDWLELPDTYILRNTYQ